jgi:hypothetical protein
MTDEPIGSALPLLHYIGKSVLIICSVAKGLIYLRLSAFNTHFKETGYFYLGMAGIDVFFLILTGDELASFIQILSLIPSLCLQLCCLYNECQGYAGVIQEFDGELSDKWIKLWQFYSRSIGAILLSALLMLISRSLSAILVLISAFATAACSIWMLILQYKSAKAVSEFA